MKKVVLILCLLMSSSAVFTSCRNESNASDDIENAAEDAGNEVEDTAEDVEDEF